ncbi:MAG TPA: hypothetical protein VFQ53_27640 [Kofleriaceae bacterium]|nr:hypothetical protein [Kofleriaceae bacterium]
MKIALLASLPLALVTPRIADACSAPSCWGGAFVPGDQGHVPANVGALIWRPMVPNGTAPDVANVVLTKATNTTPLPFTSTKLDNGDYLIVPDAPLAAGSSYVLADHNTCDLGRTGPSVTFTATDDAPLPAQLGSIDVVQGGNAPLAVGTASGSCYADVIADQVKLALVPSADAQPWMDALQFETIVDGRRWLAIGNINDTIAPGATWQGRGRDLVYAVCKTPDASIDRGLAPGEHTIEFHATLPGTAITWTTEPVTIYLYCGPDSGVSGHDAGVGCSTSDGGSPWLVLGALLMISVGRSASSARSRRG